MTVKVLQKHPDLKGIIRSDISLPGENCWGFIFVLKAENENSLHSSKSNSDTDGGRYLKG